MKTQYRSTKAKEFHTALFRYVKNSEESYYQELKKLCEDIQAKKFMVEKSLNGDTILIDILHLIPELRKKNKTLASNLVSSLLKLLKSTQAPETLLFLWITPNKAGFTPLHQAACSNKLEIVKLYISFLSKVFPKKSGSLLDSQLTTKTTSGYLPTSKNKEINDYLDSLRDYFEKLGEIHIKMNKKIFSVFFVIFIS